MCIPSFKVMSKLNSAGVEIYVTDNGALCKQRSLQLPILSCCQVEVAETTMEWSILHCIPCPNLICKQARQKYITGLKDSLIPRPFLVSRSGRVWLRETRPFYHSYNAASAVLAVMEGRPENNALKSNIIWSGTRLTKFLVPDQIAKLLAVMCRICSLVPRLSLLIASSTITGGLGTRLHARSYSLVSFPVLHHSYH